MYTRKPFAFELASPLSDFIRDSNWIMSQLLRLNQHLNISRTVIQSTLY